MIYLWCIVTFDGEGDEDEGRQYWSGTNISVNIFYFFLKYRSIKDNYNIVEGTFKQLARLEAWLEAVLTSLEPRGKHGGHRQSVYSVTFTSHVHKVVNLLIGEVRGSV